MRSSSLCHQRLKVRRGCCKAELQDLLSAGHLYSLSWAVGAPLRLVLSPLGKGLPPAKTLLSASHWGPSSSTTATAPSLHRDSDLHRVLFMQRAAQNALHCSQDAACMLSPAQPWARHDFAWKAGPRYQKLPGTGSSYGSAKVQHLSVKPSSLAASARQWEWTQSTGKQIEPKTSWCRG